MKIQEKITFVGEAFCFNVLTEDDKFIALLGFQNVNEFDEFVAEARRKIDSQRRR